VLRGGKGKGEKATGGMNSDLSMDNWSVDANGKISFPGGFRTSMVHLESWFVPEGGANGFHDVHTEKVSVQAPTLLAD
jgi:hypothetical protein